MTITMTMTMTTMTTTMTMTIRLGHPILKNFRPVAYEWTQGQSGLHLL